MSITNYTELQTAITNWTNRDDLTSVAPDFIVMAETTFNYGEGDDPRDPTYFPPLRTKWQEDTKTLTMSSNSAALPSDFLEAKRVTGQTSPVRELDYVTPSWLKEAYPSGQDSSAPRFYTIEESNLLSVVDVELVYYASLPDLASNSTNWLLTRSPNAYLFCALKHAYSSYIKRLDLAQNYHLLARNAVRGLQYTDRDAQAGVYQRRAAQQAV